MVAWPEPETNCWDEGDETGGGEEEPQSHPAGCTRQSCLLAWWGFGTQHHNDGVVPCFSLGKDRRRGETKMKQKAFFLVFFPL